MLAALDETYPDLPAGVAYVVGAVVVGADQPDVASALSRLIDAPGRARPFHWHREGPLARARLVRCLQELDGRAFVGVHYPTRRNRLEHARARVLAEILPLLLAAGASELVIESRGPAEDARDRAVILDVLQAEDMPGALTYDWRTKTEPLLWLADGLCGAVRQHLIDAAAAPHFDELVAAGVLSSLTYVAPRRA